MIAYTFVERNLESVMRSLTKFRNKYGLEGFNTTNRFLGIGDSGFRRKITRVFSTIPEVAELLKVNPKTIYRAVWSKQLPAYKVGKAWRIADKDIELFRK